jgi:hypothetical protein
MMIKNTDLYKKFDLYLKLNGHKIKHPCCGCIYQDHKRKAECMHVSKHYIVYADFYTLPIIKVLELFCIVEKISINQTAEINRNWCLFSFADKNNRMT